MLEQLSRNWWMLTVRGVCAILFGLLAWIWPGITLWALVILFGAYALVDGIFAIGAAITGHARQSRIWLAVVGVCGVLLGLVTLFWPHITGLVLLLLIAWWAIITGLFEIMAAIRLRNEIEGEWFYIVTGAVSVLFGVLLFIWPASGALAIIWVIGLFSILFGVVLVMASFRLRKLASQSVDQPRMV
jgi:uncharacterized membrane protein HdeD (DUF308 family)